jgi:hypothetical protein
MLSLVEMLAGLVLLLCGRRLYWLFVAGIGFLTGLALAPSLLVGQPEWVILVAALVLALVGAVLAVVAQKFVIALIGLLAGAGCSVLLLRELGVDSTPLAWIVHLLAGVAGLILMLVLFEWALVVLSSLAGADLLVLGARDHVALSRSAAFWLVCLIALVGIAAQAGWAGVRRRRARP